MFKRWRVFLIRKKKKIERNQLKRILDLQDEFKKSKCPHPESDREPFGTCLQCGKQIKDEGLINDV